MSLDADVIIIGSGAGGAVAAKELGEFGMKVLVLEAGPWYGNKQWKEPNQYRGQDSSSNALDLDVSLLRQQYNRYENSMNDIVTGRFRWGPADRRQTTWHRNIPNSGIAWQVSGVGGIDTTLLGKLTTVLCIGN